MSQNVSDVSPVRAIVFGAGYFGRLHAAKYAAMQEVELLAVIDRDPARAEVVAAEFGTTGTTDPGPYLDAANAVSIVTPCMTHFEIASACLHRGCHVLVEKPMTATLEEADALIHMAAERGRILQVGHQERIFVTGLDLGERLGRPLEIRCRRISPLSGRGQDCSVVMDLMIHDLDFVLSLVDGPVTDLRVLAGGTHASSVRMDFADGSRAYLEADRDGVQRHRSARLQDGRATIEIDFLARKCRHSGGELIECIRCPVVNGHAHAAGFVEADDLGHAIAAFVHSIRSGGEPVVNAEAGRKALAVALRIDAATSRGNVVAPAASAG